MSPSDPLLVGHAPSSRLEAGKAARVLAVARLVKRFVSAGGRPYAAPPHLPRESMPCPL